jgi:hypothetical protein
VNNVGKILLSLTIFTPEASHNSPLLSRDIVACLSKVVIQSFPKGFGRMFDKKKQRFFWILILIMHSKYLLTVLNVLISFFHK